MNLQQAKALFFAQYLFQPILTLAGRKNEMFKLSTFDINENKIAGTLFLRTVDQLTDGEKVIIAELMQIYPEDVIDWINGDCGHDDFENLNTWLPCYDILKAFGIILPLTYLNEENKPVTLQPDEIISLGWAKIKVI